MNMNKIVTTQCWEPGCPARFETTYAIATAGRVYCEQHTLLRPGYARWASTTPAAELAALDLAQEREGAL